MKNKTLLALSIWAFSSIAYSGTAFQVQDINLNTYNLGEVAQPSDICSMLNNDIYKYYRRNDKEEFFSVPQPLSTKLFSTIPPTATFVTLTQSTIEAIHTNIKTCLSQLVQNSPETYKLAVDAGLESPQVGGAIHRGSRLNFSLALGFKEGYQILKDDQSLKLPILKAKFEEASKIEKDRQDAIDKANNEKLEKEAKEKQEAEDKASSLKWNARWSSLFNFMLIALSLAAGTAAGWFFRIIQIKKSNQIRENSLSAAHFDNSNLDLEDDHPDGTFAGDLKHGIKNGIKDLGKLETYFDLSEGKSTGLLGKLVRKQVDRNKSGK